MSNRDNANALLQLCHLLSRENTALTMGGVHQGVWVCPNEAHKLITILVVGASWKGATDSLSFLLPIKYSFIIYQSERDICICSLWM